jgi:hypothetical protein
MEIQTYPDSSKITKAQREQLGMLNLTLPVVKRPILIFESTSLSSTLDSRRALYRNSRVRYILRSHVPESVNTSCGIIQCLQKQSCI